jgi:DNA-binding MarR family transcriptional regulator
MPLKSPSKKVASPARLPVRLRDQAQQSAAESKELRPSTLLVLLAMYRAFGVLDRNQAEELGSSHLSNTQFNALAVLHRAKDPLTMRQLAEMMAVQSTNLSGIVKSLRLRGLVQQQVNGEDTRSLLVSLTKEGGRFMQKFSPTHWKRIENVMAGLAEPDRATLVQLLEILVKSIRAAEAGNQGK